LKIINNAGLTNFSYRIKREKTKHIFYIFITKKDNA